MLMIRVASSWVAKSSSYWKTISCLAPSTILDRLAVSLVCFGSSSSSSSTTFEEERNNTSTTTNDRDLRIQIPKHPHGYRITPFTWAELQDIVNNNTTKDDLSRLCRSIPTQMEYEVYKIQLQNEWHSLYDHMLCSKFGIPSQRHATSGLRQAQMNPTTTALDLPQLSLLPNEFPYFVQEPIQHWVLWKLGGDCSVDNVAWAQQELHQRVQKTGSGICDMMHWINPLHLKSIPEVDHVHILVLPNE